MTYRENDGMFYFFENDGLKNQSVLYRKPTVDSTEREVFLDPNTLSDDGTVAPSQESSSQKTANTQPTPSAAAAQTGPKSS